MIWIALAVYALGFAAAFVLASMQGGTERDDPPFEWRLRFGIALLWPVVLVVAIVVFFREIRQ